MTVVYFFHTDFSSIHFLCNAYFSTASNKYHPIDWCQFIVIFSKIISNCPWCISITGIYLHIVNGTCFKKRFHAFFFRQTGHIDDWHWRQTGLNSKGAPIYRTSGRDTKSEAHIHMYEFGAGNKNHRCMCTCGTP